FKPSGQLCWQHLLTASHPGLPTNIEVGAPVFAHGVVYFGSPVAQEEVAIDASDGQMIWQTQVQAPIGSSAAVAHHTVLVVTTTGQVFALNQKTGRIIHRNDWGGRFQATFPLVLGHTVYLANWNGTLYARPWSRLV
ncbi:MAG: PQQ-binding-like beta-propeller repeat protein, partial [Firmicutes bacterium]|nr:PQQ-binding-like beta-propeller repeat protein [Bacillota bacterium]